MAWINKTTTVYHIFLDRFYGFQDNMDAKKPVFCGGTINGVIKKLDWIQSMGFDTVWISPFYTTSAYHGYHITDFDQVDRRFGTSDDITDLIHQCHSRNMRIIADIVPNHCSQEHKWFIEAKRDKRSIFRDWFYFSTDKKDYLKFLGFPELPKLNLENKDTANYMINSLLNWASFGFDGFRIDHVVGLPDAFLKRLRNELLEVNPEFILIGEAWSEGMKYKYLRTLRIGNKHKLWKNGFKQQDLQNHYQGIIDGVLDFGWREIILGAMKDLRKGKIKNARQKISAYNLNCPDNLYLPRFLDNHDTSRIMYLCGGSEKLFELCLELVFEQPYPVIMYYGTEFGLSHDKTVSPEIGFSDLGARQLPPWEEPSRYKKLVSQLIGQRKYHK
jgi:glycosidase